MFSGAAVGESMTEEEAKACMVNDLYAQLSPLAIAYAKARGTIRDRSEKTFAQNLKKLTPLPFVHSDTP